MTPWGNFWGTPGVTLGLPWDYFEGTLQVVWGNCEGSLGSLWRCPGFTLGVLWGHLEDTLWSLLEYTSTREVREISLNLCCFGDSYGGRDRG